MDNGMTSLRNAGIGGRRWLAAVFLGLGVAVTVAWPLAGAASAEVVGGCSASLKGVDIAGRSSTKAGDAIDVDYREQLVARSTAPAPITGYKIQLEFGGFRWTVARGTSSGNTWQREVAVGDYASHGVGLYKVIGTSTGPGACTGAALVNVKGKSPLSTTAGLAGAALTGVGALGLAATAVRAMSPRAVRPGARFIALLALPAMMTVGMGLAAPVPVRGGAGEPSARWRFRLSLLGLVGGVLGGLGVVVLLQQYAVAYPTRGVALAGIGAGIVLSLLASNVPQLVAVRRLERASTGAVAPAPAPDVAAPAPDAAADAEAGWVPTHMVSDGGVAAFSEPDLPSETAGALDPWLEVEVFERSGTWAHVRCSNGWSAWVDGDRLVEVSR